jgi:hypothetical protein
LKKTEPWPYPKTRPPGWETPAREPLAQRLSKTGSAFIEAGKTLLAIAILLPVLVVLGFVAFVLAKAWLFP